MNVPLLLTALAAVWFIACLMRLWIIRQQPPTANDKQHQSSTGQQPRQ